MPNPFEQTIDEEKEKQLELRWFQFQAIEFCKQIETYASSCNFHIALTGGCLYKEGVRKDCDIIVYSVRQESPNINTFLDVLEDNKICTFVKRGGWHNKAMLDNGRSVDFLYPEYEKLGSDNYVGTI